MASHWVTTEVAIKPPQQHLYKHEFLLRLYNDGSVAARASVPFGACTPLRSLASGSPGCAGIAGVALASGCAGISGVSLIASGSRVTGSPRISGISLITSGSGISGISGVSLIAGSALWPGRTSASAQSKRQNYQRRCYWIFHKVLLVWLSGGLCSPHYIMNWQLLEQGTMRNI